MKKFILALLLFLTPFTLSAQGGPDAQGGAFTGGTLSSSLTMSDSTAVELATGALTNLSLRLRSDLNTGWYSPSPDAITLALGGADIVQYSAAKVYSLTHNHAVSYNSVSDGKGYLYPTGLTSGYIGWVYGGAAKGGFSQWRSSSASRVFYGPDFAKTTCDVGLCLFGPTGALYGVDTANQANAEWAEWSFASDTRDVSILAVASGTGNTRNILIGHKKNGVLNTVLTIATDSASISGFTKLGESSAKFKHVYLTGTTPPSGASYGVAHGIASSGKIISVNAVIHNGAAAITPGFPAGSGNYFFAYADGTNAIALFPGADSTNLYSKQIDFDIIFQE